jgi:hypothetical protein
MRSPGLLKNVAHASPHRSEPTIARAAYRPDVDDVRILRVQSTNPCDIDPTTGTPFDSNACQTQQQLQGNTVGAIAGGAGGAWGIGGTILCAIAEPCGAAELTVITVGGLIALGGLITTMLFGGSGGYSMVTSKVEYWTDDMPEEDYWYEG